MKMFVPLFFVSWIGYSSPAIAVGQVDLLAGYFSLSSKVSDSTSTISAVGAYQLGYRQSFLSQFQVLIGYSINATKTIGGDLEFGPDLGVLYFPLTRSSPLEAQSEGVSVVIEETWRPFLGVGFHQRQYQSTQSSFAGFGGYVGVDYNYWPSTALISQIRYIRLLGPGGSTAGELDVFVGLSFRVAK